MHESIPVFTLIRGFLRITTISPSIMAFTISYCARASLLSFPLDFSLV